MKVLNLDREEIKKRAARNMDNNKLERKTVISLLNDALATELVCVLRYRQHYYVAKGGRGLTVAAELLAHSNEELVHADRLAERISQLGEFPQFDPNGIVKRSHTSYGATATDLLALLGEDLTAERIAIETYSQMIRYVGNEDPTTRRVLEEILAQEEEHADDLKSMIAKYGPELKQARTTGNEHLGTSEGSA